MATYPSAIKSFSTLVDGADSALAAHQNERGAEIMAIETELGTNPKGSDADVSTRIGRIDTELGTNPQGSDADVAERLDRIDAAITSNRTHTMIDGLKLTWDSATSITVGVGACYAENDDWIDVTSALVKSGLSLSSSTWYHVYVYLSGGSPAAEVVTTAPTAWKSMAYSKTGDTSRRYVGSVKTDGSSNIYKFLHDGKNRIVYSSQDFNSSPFRIINNGTSTATSPAATIDCSGLIPVTGKYVITRISDTSTTIAYFGSSNSITSSSYDFTDGSTASIIVLDHPLDSSRYFYYFFTSTPSGSLYVSVQGYVFER